MEKPKTELVASTVKDEQRATAQGVRVVLWRKRIPEELHLPMTSYEIILR